MKKIFLFMIIGIFLLSGCSFKEQTHDVNTIYYDLSIQNYYKENITFTLPKNAYELATSNINVDFDSLEYILLIDNFSRPIHNNLYTLYGKRIYSMDQAIEVDLNFDYLEKDFVHSNYMNTCFQKHVILDEDDYLEIHLNGEFYCLQDKTMTIHVSSEYEKEMSNGRRMDDGSFEWYIDSSNVNNVDIYYKVFRDKESMVTAYGLLQKHMDHDTVVWIEFFVIIAVLVGGFFFYKLLYNREFNKD